MGSKKVAKNTVILYLRMMIVMIINLYTVRVVLRSLGIEDYGIYVRDGIACVTREAKIENCTIF